MRLATLFLLPLIASAEVSFNQHIRPILSKNCIACHGPDTEDRKGDFHLDTFEGLTKKNDDGKAGAIPGDPDASLIIQRVVTTDPDDQMPPPDHGSPLSGGEIDLLKQWIKEGADYERHWSLNKPKSVTPPASTHPSPKNDIDHFVATQLAKLDLEPAPTADPRILLRRLSLDLTGLPPTIEEVEAFAADPSEANYLSAVDRYLASPSYGEHWAALWLDIARYADTVGYSGDEHRDIWPWRDWVIDAFNTNMPYDRFTIEQLAGDLLPNATQQQILATAFHRNTLSNNEGGTSDEEFRTIAVKDRISTTVNAWMGLTIRCAECHTHKYDPISQKEYYQFYDFFNQTEDNDQKDDRPRIDVLPKGREVEAAASKAKLTKLKKDRESNPSPWTPVQPLTAISEGGATVEPQPDGTYLFTGKNPEYDTYLLSGTTTADTTGFRLDLYPSRVHNDNFGRGPEGAMVLNHLVITVDGAVQKITKASASYGQPNHHIKNVIGDQPHKNGWAANHPSDGYKGRRHAIFTLATPIPAGKPFSIKLVHQSQWPRLNIGRLSLSTTTTPDPAGLHDQKKLDPLGRQIAALEKNLLNPIRVPILQERKDRRTTRIMSRGSYLQPTDEVTAAVPEAFNFWPEGAPNNRLGVAQWIMSPDNPLTARVAANRLWARLFGMGIVETEEDFGIQGILPSHPDLLDWLALEYQNNWDTKALLKLIVSSHTYRQSAVTDSLRLEKDPRNVYLSRGPRFRLSAEAVRDSALAVSGLLSTRQYGPPVYPPNPIKKYVNAFTGGMTWVESKGDDRHRRALYTYLKRSSPHPLFETFDMATRDVCNMRRIRTNTPLQSFMTLNDIAFIEAAQSLAGLMTAHSPNPEEQIAHGLHRALLRPGSPEQINTLLSLYRDTLSDYQDDPEAAKKLSGQPSPEHAALTVVANIILNLDAFLTK
ncbi:MAG: PSD1 and planctomycete cytochrome C domain-containing protein [Verrucomicrobiaceae bacterium]